MVEGNAPANVFGVSINAFGKAKVGADGLREVQSIDSVRSVDDVTQPAAGGGFMRLNEQEDGEDIYEWLFEDMTVEEFKEHGGDLYEELKTSIVKLRGNEQIEQLTEQIAEKDTAIQARDAQIVSITEARDAALQNAASQGHALDVMTRIRSTSLPAEMVYHLETDLFEEKDQGKWDGILAKYGAISQRTPALPTQQIQEARHNPAPALRSDPTQSKKWQFPRVNEDYDAFMARVN